MIVPHRSKHFFRRLRRTPCCTALALRPPRNPAPPERTGRFRAIDRNHAAPRLPRLEPANPSLLSLSPICRGQHYALPDSWQSYHAPQLPSLELASPSLPSPLAI